MPGSVSKLREMLSHIRQDMGALSAISRNQGGAGQPSTSPPGSPPESPFPATQVDPRPAYPDEDAPALEHRPSVPRDAEFPDEGESDLPLPPAPALGPNRSGVLKLLTPVAQAAFLGLAAMGGYQGHQVLLGAGLAGLAVVALVPLLSPRTTERGDWRDLEARLSALERRVENLAYSAETGTVSRELEEDIREVRRIVISLVKSVSGR